MTGTDAPPAWMGCCAAAPPAAGTLWPSPFTNKAAGGAEGTPAQYAGWRRGRRCLPPPSTLPVLRILRRYAEEIGYPRSFTIYDTDDSQRVMKAVYKELSVDDKFLPIKTATNQMSRWKGPARWPCRCPERPRPGYKGGHVRPHLCSV